MNRVSAFLNRKVAGVKVLYLIAVAVLGLAIAAYFVRPKDATVTDEVSDTAAASGTGTGSGEVSDTDAVAYPVTSSGTVVVQPTAATATDTENASIPDNATWTSRGVAFLVSQGVSGTAAQTALNVYLTNGQLSTTQKRYADQVIAEYGLPPFGKEDYTSDSGARSLVRYVKVANGNDVYAQYSDNTLYYVTGAEFVALGSPSVTTLADSDPVWQYPTFRNGAAVSNAVLSDPSAVERYVKRTDEADVYAVRRDGTREQLTAAGWAAKGSPAYETLPTDDPIWNTPLAGGSATASVTGYIRTPDQSVFQLWSDGTKRKLTLTEYRRLGSPSFADVPATDARLSYRNR